MIYALIIIAGMTGYEGETIYDSMRRFPSRAECMFAANMETVFSPTIGGRRAIGRCIEVSGFYKGRDE